MGVSDSRDELQGAVVEHPASSRHIDEPVDHLPRPECQWRIVCLAARGEDVWKIAHLSGAASSGPYTYTLCPADAAGGDEPESSPAGSDDRKESNAGGTTRASQKARRKALRPTLLFRPDSFSRAPVR